MTEVNTDTKRLDDSTRKTRKHTDIHTGNRDDGWSDGDRWAGGQVIQTMNGSSRGMKKKNRQTYM